MNRHFVKRFVKNVFRTMGFSLKRITGDEELDAFEIQKYLTHRNPQVIFDVGAYDGKVTTQYYELFPDAVIHAFEPFPDSYHQLMLTVGGHKKIHAHNYAISNEDGPIRLYTNRLSATNSILSTDAKGIQDWGQDKLGTIGEFHAEAITIDTFCKKNTINQIDILKLDIQGAEILALKGAKDLLSRQLISVLYFEMIISPTYQKQGKIHECFQWLDSYGYELFDIYTPVRRNNRLMQIDVIFTTRAIYDQN